MSTTDTAAELKNTRAELHNLRERGEKDRGQAYRDGMESVYRSVLPVLDGFASAADHGDMDDLPGGIRTLIAGLAQSLEKNGLSEIGSVGDTFDPDIHEAVQMVHSEDVAYPQIKEIIQRGYQTDYRVLRPAKVVVVGP